MPDSDAAGNKFDSRGGHFAGALVLRAKSSVCRWDSWQLRGLWFRNDSRDKCMRLRTRTFYENMSSYNYVRPLSWKGVRRVLRGSQAQMRLPHATRENSVVSTLLLVSLTSTAPTLYAIGSSIELFPETGLYSICITAAKKVFVISLQAHLFHSLINPQSTE